jgi:parallel beta helix pectate lyase-like protein/chondroitinase B-like protein
MPIWGGFARSRMIMRSTLCRSSLIVKSRFARLVLACVAISLGACTSTNAAGPFESNSLQAEIDRAQPGDKVVIPPGTYREFIQITHSGTPQRPITIEAVAGKVVITGADSLESDRWEPLPGRPVWRYSSWTYQAPARHDLGQSGRVYSGEEVIVDGRLLSRAASLASMQPGTFFADPIKDHALFLWLSDGSSPAKHTVEASARPLLLKITGNHIIVRNIRFRYASNVAQQGAVQVGGEHNLIENCVVEYTAGVGLTLGGQHNVVRRVTSGFNGQMGMGAIGQDNVVEECKLIHNNTLDYPTEWEAGGIKVVLSDRFRISRCLAKDNNGVGFWFDIDDRDSIIERSDAFDNEVGIMVEISQRTTVRNNVVVRNGLNPNRGWRESGILIAESNNTLVESNICVDNRAGIAVRQQGVRTVPANPERGRLEPVRFYSDGLLSRHNISAFNRQWQFAFFGDNPFFGGKYLWMIRRLFGKGDRGDAADMQLLDPSKWLWRMDRNVYFAQSGSGLILWGAPWLSGHTVYESLDTFRRDHHLDQHSIVADPEFADRRRGDFSLRPGSPAVKLVYPSPSPFGQDEPEREAPSDSSSATVQTDNLLH